MADLETTLAMVKLSAAEVVAVFDTIPPSAPPEREPSRSARFLSSGFV